MLDGILSILDVTNSLTEFSYDYNSVNMLEFFINNSVIENLFWNIFIFTIGLTSIFCVIGIIKVMIKNNTSIFNVLSKFIIAIVSVLIVLLLIIIGIMLSTKFIELLKEVFNIDLQFNLSKIIFNNSVMEWYNNYSISEIDFSNITVNDLLGEYDKDGLLPTNWLHNGMINPESFQYLPCLITSIISVVSLLIVVIRLIKRVYEVILLYLTMPVSIASLPVDDGKAFKNWLEVFINRIVIVYSSIIIINLFFFIFPILNEFSISINSEYHGLFKLLLIMGSIVSLTAGQILFNKILKFKNYNNTSVFKTEIIDNNHNIIDYQDENHHYIDDFKKGVRN